MNHSSEHPLCARPGQTGASCTEGVGIWASREEGGRRGDCGESGRRSWTGRVLREEVQPELADQPWGRGRTGKVNLCSGDGSMHRVPPGMGASRCEISSKSRLRDSGGEATIACIYLLDHKVSPFCRRSTQPDSRNCQVFPKDGVLGSQPRATPSLLT